MPFEWNSTYQLSDSQTLAIAIKNTGTARLAPAKEETPRDLARRNSLCIVTTPKYSSDFDLELITARHFYDE